MAETIARLVTAIEYQVQGQQEMMASLETTNRSLQGMEGVVGAVGKAFVGAFAVEKIIGFVSELVSAADRFDDLSAKTDIAVGTLQELNFAFAGTGVTIEQMSGAVAQMSRRLVDGDSGAVGALKQLGLNANDLIRMAPDQAFLKIAEAIREVPNPMEQSTIAMKLFGRAGAELLPVLRQNLADLMKQARDTNAVMSDETVAAAGMFDTAYERMEIRLKATAAETVAYAVEHNRLTAAIRDVSSIATFISAGNAMEDVLNRIRSPLNSLATVEMPAVIESHKELMKIETELTNGAMKSIEQGLKRQQDEAKRAAEEHRKLNAIIGLGIMEAARQYVEAMAIFKSESMEFNAVIDEVGENFKNTWSKDVTATIVDGSKVAGDVLDTLAQRGMLASQEMTTTMGGYFSEMFSDIGQGVEGFMGMLANALGPRMGATIRQFQEAWSHGRSMWQGILRGMSGDFSGWMDAIMGGIGLIRSAWDALSGLFRGGEEGTTVNPARDKFLSQWGDPSNKGVGGAGHNLAALLTSLGAGDGGGSIFSALQGASTMAAFRPAAQAIVEFLNAQGHSASMNFHTGGMVPGTGEVPATLLGGERVQSRSEVGDMRGMASDIRGLRHDQQRLLRTLGKEIAAQMQFAMAQQA
jgi:hypothetical protein